MKSKKEIEQNFIFDKATRFNEDKACVKIGTYCFEIDNKGKILFKIKADDLQRFDENSFLFEIKGKWGIINNYKEIIITPQYDEIDYAGGNFYIAKKNNKYGILDMFETNKIDFKYEYLEFIIMNPPYFLAVLNGRKGIIDLHDDIILPFDYDDIHSFYDDESNSKLYFKVKYNDKWGFVNKNNKPLKINIKDFMNEIDTVEQTKFIFDGEILN